MNIILFDGEEWEHLLPLTFTKPVASLRMGVLSFAERWKKILNTTVSYQTQPYLEEKFSTDFQLENIFINPSFFPTKELIDTIKELELNESILFENKLVAVKTSEKTPSVTSRTIQLEEIIHIKNSWDLFTYNFQAIE